MTEQAPTDERISASLVRSVRLVAIKERPGDALLQITTHNGVQAFLIPKSGLPKLAESLKAFADRDTGATPAASPGRVN